MQPTPPSNVIHAEISRLVRLARREGAPDCYTGKRTQKRISDAMQLEVSTDPARASATWGVSMQDISNGGAAFWSRREISIRSEIFVREFSPEAPRPWIPGKVKHVTRGIRGFLVGVEFPRHSNMPIVFGHPAPYPRGLPFRRPP